MNCDDSLNFHRFWELSALRPLVHRNKPVLKSTFLVINSLNVGTRTQDSGDEQENVTESHRCYLVRDEEENEKAAL
jgi:hypothetical protein